MMRALPILDRVVTRQEIDRVWFAFGNLMEFSEEIKRKEHRIKMEALEKVAYLGNK